MQAGLVTQDTALVWLAAHLQFAAAGRQTPLGLQVGVSVTPAAVPKQLTARP